MTPQSFHVSLGRTLSAILLLIIASDLAAAQESEFSFSRSAPYDTYLPGAPVDITVTFEYAGNQEVTALALVEQLPLGWTYDSVVAADSTPAVVDLPTGLQFTWVTIPAFPSSITYRVNTAAATSGRQTITGVAPYRLDAEELVAGPVDYDLFEAAFSLTTEVSGVGNVSPGPGTIHLASPHFFTLEAIETEDAWVFTGWGGDIFGEANPREILIDQDRRVVAEFSQTFSLIIEQQGSGTVGPPPGNYTYISGTEVTVAATPAPGYLFAGWEGDLTGSDFSDTVVMDGNKQVRAVFLPRVSLTMTQIGEGTVVPAPGEHIYPAPAQLALSATPAEGWAFAGWEGAVSGSSSPVSLTLFTDAEVTAVFKRLYTVNVSVEGAGRTIPEAGEYLVVDGDSFQVGAIPEAAATFLGWGGSLESSENPLVIPVTSPLDLVARFSGTGEGEATEGAFEGSVFEGEGESDPFSSADQDMDYMVSLSELLRVVQFYNSGGFSCATPPESTEDGFQPGTGSVDCAVYSADYNPQDWDISLSELLRIIQVFNSAGYEFCPQEPDGLCPIPKPEDAG